MKQYNTQNEIVKKQYEAYLELDGKLSKSTISCKVKSLWIYEKFTNFKDFKTFNQKQALSFKASYKKKDISLSTILRNLENMQRFFKWLYNHPSYRTRVNINHIKAFNLTFKEEDIARSISFKNIATLEQIYKVVGSMPTATETELRNRAMVAFTLLTGVRISAMISLKLKHIDEYKKLVKQDPREVKTKFSKAINTWFFPIREDIEQIVLDWIKYLKEEKVCGLDTPLFPAVQNGYDKETQSFIKTGVSKKHINSTTTVRGVFKQAFSHVSMECFNPHSFRHTLVQYGERHCKTPEAFKSWSQNLGHSHMLTTFTSYGEVPAHREGDIIRGLGE